MKPNFHKTVLWLAGIAAYFLLVAVVLAMLFEPEVRGYNQTSRLLEVAHGDDMFTRLSELEAVGSAQGVLLPIGPDDTVLPGLPEIWGELMKVTEEAVHDKAVSGFDGLQAVSKVSELTQGALSELFISGVPVSVSRVGHTLFLLTSHDRVLQLDCKKPESPQLTGFLPYLPVKKMVVKDTKAFLLIKNKGLQSKEMVVLDLSRPAEITELARFTLQGPVINFFLFDGQLLTYENVGGRKNEQRLSIYDITEGYEIRLAARVKSPKLTGPSIISGRYLLSPDIRDGLNVYALGNLSEPSMVATLPLGGTIRRLARFGNQLFALGTHGQFYLIDLSDIEAPVLSRKIEDANYLAYFLNFGGYSYYFSGNGYLRVFGASVAQLAQSSQSKYAPLPSGIAESADRKSLLHLGELGGLIDSVEISSLPMVDFENVVAVESWGDFYALLDEDGRLSVLRRMRDGTFSLIRSISLAGKYRWLARSGSTLYAGGHNLEVIDYAPSGDITHVGSVSHPRFETLDGVVVGNTLFAAGGKAGVMMFSLQDPSRPEIMGPLEVPGPMASLVDARQLSQSKQRLLVAAGPAGLLVIKTTPAPGGSLAGALMFENPLVAVHAINDLVLASDRSSVHVIDLWRNDSMQKLGQIAYAGVESFALAGNGLWAGYVPGKGWTVLPQPDIISSVDLAKIRTDVDLPGQNVARYRLRMFNEYGVVDIPGVLSLAALSRLDQFGEGHVSH